MAAAISSGIEELRAQLAAASISPVIGNQLKEIADGDPGVDRRASR